MLWIVSGEAETDTWRWTCCFARSMIPRVYQVSFTDMNTQRFGLDREKLRTLVTAIHAVYSTISEKSMGQTK
ncbi:hypothetical protein K440DRAFT_258794 [Wilcoxina mikolae CBS 423.85]|nr:hypothetical protein K440DRAFT_258794 [Wilcoxina mikolae CBS 423.85]